MKQILVLLDATSEDDFSPILGMEMPEELPFKEGEEVTDDLLNGLLDTYPTFRAVVENHFSELVDDARLVSFEDESGGVFSVKFEGEAADRWNDAIFVHTHVVPKI